MCGMHCDYDAKVKNLGDNFNHFIFFKITLKINSFYSYKGHKLAFSPWI